MNKGIYQDKKSKKWHIHTTIKINEEFKTCTIRGYQTKREADADYERAIAEWVKEHGGLVTVKFFSELIQEYKNYRLKVIKITSAREENYTIDKHILASFENQLLKDVFKPKVMSEWHDILYKNEEFGSCRKNVIIRYMKAVLKFAYSHLYIDADTFQQCDVVLHFLKANKKPKQEKVAWTYGEARTFLNTINKNDEDYVIMRLFWHLGCRISEFLGLQWKFHNYEESTLEIVHQAVPFNGKGRGNWSFEDNVISLKNGEERKVILSGDINELLQEYRDAIGAKPDDFITSGTVEGQPLSHNAFRNRLKKYIDKAKVRYTSPHGARHSNATWLMKNCKTLEDVKAAAKRLGHSASMMMDTYGHVLGDNENKLIKSISDGLDLSGINQEKIKT